MVEDINELTVAAAADLVSEQTTKVYIVPVTILIKFCLERRLFEKKTYYDVCITLKKRTRQTWNPFLSHGASFLSFSSYLRYLSEEIAW